VLVLPLCADDSTHWRTEEMGGKSRTGYAEKVGAFGGDRDSQSQQKNPTY
jgi:hypothetical protein